MGFFIALIFLAIPCSLMTAHIADSKGLGKGWWLLGLVFGPIGLATAIGMPDLKTRGILRLLAEQQGGAKEVLSPPAPTPEPYQPTPKPTRAPRDPNKKRTFMDRMDDAMDPDRDD